MEHNRFTTLVLLIGLIGLWVIGCIIFKVVWLQIEEVSKNKFIRLILKALLVLASYQLLMSDFTTLN